MWGREVTFGERHGSGATTSLAGNGGGCLGRLSQPRFGEIGSVGKTCRFSHDHADARPAVVAGRELLDLSVVEGDTGRGAVLDEDLGESAAAAECRAEDPFENVGLDEAREGSPGRRGRRPGRIVAGQRRMFPSMPPTAPAPTASFLSSPM